MIFWGRGSRYGWGFGFDWDGGIVWMAMNCSNGLPFLCRLLLFVRSGMPESFHENSMRNFSICDGMRCIAAKVRFSLVLATPEQAAECMILHANWLQHFLALIIQHHDYPSCLPVFSAFGHHIPPSPSPTMSRFHIQVLHNHSSSKALSQSLCTLSTSNLSIFHPSFLLFSIYAFLSAGFPSLPPQR